LEHWFTPWRGSYVSSARSEADCILCSISRSRSDRENLVLLRAAENYILVNRFPYNNGHLMIVPYRHCAFLEELEPTARGEMIELAALCENALRSAYRPEGLNLGINLGRIAGAGIDEHLHLHILPRWSGDTNFMTVVGGTRIIPEETGATYERLEPLLREGRGDAKK